MPQPARSKYDLFLAYKALSVAWAFVPFQVGLFQAQGLSLAQVFDLNIAFSLASILFEVPTGLFADRWGRTTAMALGGLAMPFACALFLLGHDFATLALAQVFAALSMTLASGADRAWLFDTLDAAHPKDREKVLSRYRAIDGRATQAKAIGNAFAIFLAIPLYRLWGGSVFLLTGVCTLGATALALRLPETRLRKRRPLREDVGSAVYAVATRPRLASVMLYGPLTWVLLRISLFADQPHVELHLPSLDQEQRALVVGLVWVSKEALGILVAVPSSRLLERLRVRYHTLGLAAFLVLAYSAMGFGFGPLDVALIIALAGAQVFHSQQVSALLAALIPKEDPNRATLYSVESAGRRILGALALPLFGRAAESASLHGALGATALVSLGLCVLLGLWALRIFRSAPRPRVASGPPSALLSQPPA